MDEKKAIDCLKNIIEYWTHKPTEVEAANLAIQALKKQIPKRVPETYHVMVKDIEMIEYGECPSCGHTGLKKYTHEHCWWCGQRLEWIDLQADEIDSVDWD